MPPMFGQRLVRVPPHPSCFLTQSAERIEKKRVAFLGSAKKRKRVCKLLVLKGTFFVEERRMTEECSTG
jgi:hypothetical protein